MPNEEDTALLTNGIADLVYEIRVEERDIRDDKRSIIDPVDDRGKEREDRITIKAIVGDYLLHRRGIRSIDKLHSLASPLLAGLGDRRAVRATSSDVEAYVAAREALGRARATINRELELLRAAYRPAAGQKPRKVSPSQIPHFQIPKVHNARRGFLSHEQVEAILAGISDLDLRD